jgi:hypothetical protein
MDLLCKAKKKKKSFLNREISAIAAFRFILFSIFFVVIVVVFSVLIKKKQKLLSFFFFSVSA